MIAGTEAGGMIVAAVYEVNGEQRRRYSATRRGVRYMAARDAAGWYVHAFRIGLGWQHVGSVTRFASLDELAQKTKAFAALPTLLSADAGNA